MVNIVDIKDIDSNTSTKNEELETDFRKESIQLKNSKYLINTTCAIKNTLTEDINKIVKEYNDTSDKIIEGYIPAGCGGNEGTKNILDIENIEVFPDLVIERGFGTYFTSKFTNKFLKKDYFKSIKRNAINKDFLGLGIDDSDYYTPYAVIPFLIVIDKTKIGNLKVPNKWSDLLDPMYRDNIIIGGNEKDISDILLLYIYKEHGEAGIEKLASNVKNKMHWTKMIKLLGTQKEESTAIYVMPWFFAEACPKDKDILVVWPEDGAIISPMYMIVKELMVKNMKVIIDFVNGVDFGKKSAKVFYPVLNPEVNNNLPKNAFLKWIGWDYLMSNNIEELRKYTKDIFMNNFKNECN